MAGPPPGMPLRPGAGTYAAIRDALGNIEKPGCEKPELAACDTVVWPRTCFKRRMNTEIRTGTRTQTRRRRRRRRIAVGRR